MLRGVELRYQSYWLCLLPAREWNLGPLRRVARVVMADIDWYSQPLFARLDTSMAGRSGFSAVTVKLGAVGVEKELPRGVEWSLWRGGITFRFSSH